MREKKVKIIGFLLIILSFLQLNLFISVSLGRTEVIYGSTYTDYISTNENVTYYFTNHNNIFNIKVNRSINLNIHYANQVSNRQTSLIVNNSESISLDISSKAHINSYGLSKNPKEPKKSNHQLRYRYNCIYKIRSNQSIDNLTIRYIKRNDRGLNSNAYYTLVLYKSTQDSWDIVDTSEMLNESNSEIYLESLLLNLEGNVDYYVTLYEIYDDINDGPWFIFIFFMMLSVGAISIVILITKKDYINYLKTRLIPIDTGCHRLTLEDVLENENRNKIIDFILKEPSIHFNELLRKTNLAAGNLVWHLEILTKYKIIGKKTIGRFVSYFPYYQSNPLSNIDLQLKKSKPSLEILEIIENEPGIWNSIITKRLKMDHTSISYHIRKLKDLGLIRIIKSGRKNKLYTNFESEYYNMKKT